MKVSDLSWEEKKKALESPIFVTEKMNRDIKVRKVVDGSKQRTYDGYDKSDGSSSTVVTESICMTGVVNTKERRYVAALDRECLLTSWQPQNRQHVVEGEAS